MVYAAPTMPTNLNQYHHGKPGGTTGRQQGGNGAERRRRGAEGEKGEGEKEKGGPVQACIHHQFGVFVSDRPSNSRMYVCVCVCACVRVCVRFDGEKGGPVQACNHELGLS